MHWPHETLEVVLATLNDARRSGACEASTELLARALAHVPEEILSARPPEDRQAVRALLAETGRSPQQFTLAEIEQLWEQLLDRPARRLAVYGTLAPGEVNHHIVADLGGSWTAGRVRGRRVQLDPYPLFFPCERVGSPATNHVAVQVLESPALPDAWPRLDAFEGPDYRRILVAVDTADGTRVANIYEGVAER